MTAAANSRPAQGSIVARNKFRRYAETRIMFLLFISKAASYSGATGPLWNVRLAGSPA